jgi:chloride channel protein, CIC family
MRSAAFTTFLQRLFHLRRVGGHFETPRYLLKWLFISSLIGVVAGVGAFVFTLAIKLATQFFLGRLVGFLPPDPFGEGTMGVMPLWTAARPWLLPVITTVGGLLSGIIGFSLAPEAEGHGTDAAIAAFHHGKPIRARIRWSGPSSSLGRRRSIPARLTRVQTRLCTGSSSHFRCSRRSRYVRR